MAEKYVNYVNTADGRDLLDLRYDSIKPEHLLLGETAHDATGKPIVGELVPEESNIIESGQCGDDVFWELYDNGLLVISGSGETYDYVRSNDAPFYQNSNIVNVIINEGVTTIGELLFSVCRAKNIYIPDSVEQIKSFAFVSASNLKTIKIPKKVSVIRSDTFLGCPNLASVIIPESVTSIESGAFYRRGGIETLDVFYEGTKEQWENIAINEEDNELILNATLYCEYEEVNVKEEQEVTYPTITKNGSYEIFPDEGKTLSKVNVKVEVPTESSGIIDVTELPANDIDENAVYRVTESIQTEKNEVYILNEFDLWTLREGLLSWGIPTEPTVYVVDTLPSDMKPTDVIGFSEVNIYQVKADGIAYFYSAVHGMVLTLGYFMFNDFSHDKGSSDNVYAETEYGIYTTFERFENAIKYFVRDNNQWKEITSHFKTALPNGFNEVNFLSGEYDTEDVVIAQYGKSLNVIELIKNNQTIPSKVTVDVPCTADLIANRNQIESISIEYFRRKDGSFVEFINDYAFYRALFKRINMPQTIENIGDSAFKDCSSLEKLILHENLSSIGIEAFYFCESLTSIVFPKTLTYLGYRAFKSCYGLVTVTFQAKPQLLSSDVFDGCRNLTTINVPWAEGEVDYAPWGATNATINYNYTEG